MKVWYFSVFLRTPVKVLCPHISKIKDMKVWYELYTIRGHTNLFPIKGKKVKFSPLQALEALRVVRG
jgi:hypothetical protein